MSRNDWKEFRQEVVTEIVIILLLGIAILLMVLDWVSMVWDEEGPNGDSHFKDQ